MPAQPTVAKPLDESAPEFICRLINENPGQITLCPIGPLTNIALALRLDPSIAAKVKSVVIMGGGLDKGNVTAHAEANIWNDPHAADEVFAAAWPITMVGLDVTATVLCYPPDFAKLAQAAPVLGGFLNEAVQHYFAFYENHYGLRGSQMHDPTAVIAITDPQYFTIENHALEVIVEGAHVGQTIRSADPSRPKHKVCMGVDADGVKQRFLSMIETGF
jgi:inosine-uridine nucleoside N-ribohydrolase